MYRFYITAFNGISEGSHSTSPMRQQLISLEIIAESIAQAKIKADALVSRDDYRVNNIEEIFVGDRDCDCDCDCDDFKESQEFGTGF